MIRVEAINAGAKRNTYRVTYGDEARGLCAIYVHRGYLDETALSIRYTNAGIKLYYRDVYVHGVYRDFSNGGVRIFTPEKIIRKPGGRQKAWARPASPIVETDWLDELWRQVDGTTGVPEQSDVRGGEGALGT